MAFAALQRDADTALSNNEREFIVKALKEGQRLDGRGPHELRPVRLAVALDDSACTVLLGRTRVMAVVAATLEAPYGDRPSEGSLRFNVEFSPMASPAFAPGRPGEDAVEVARLVERGLRETRAVDLEALVVLAGRKVWHLRVDIHVLDHCGNLADACGLAALAALLAFRRPDVTVGGGDDGQGITMHPPEQREPVPLSIHHLPFPVSFALFEEGGLLAVDPSLAEEAAAAGRMTITQNAFGELCSIQQIDGCGMTPAQLKACLRLAALKVEELTATVRAALDAHEVARVQARVRRQPNSAAAAAAAGAGAAGHGVTVLRSDQLIPTAGDSGAAAAAAAAAAAGGSGGATVLDLDALPDNVRSLLERAAAADGADESMSEEESGSSSSEEESEEGDESEEEEEAAAAGAAAAAPQQPPAAVQQQAAAAATPGRQAQVAVSPPAAQPSAKKRRPAPGSGSREQQRDELAAIADMIASAGGKSVGGGDDGSLAAAVKKKSKGAAAGSGGKAARGGGSARRT